MNKVKILAGILALFITLPIWFYLLHEILETVKATELMWFLYWVYLPVSFVSLAVANLFED